MTVDQNEQHAPDSHFWDVRASELIAQARNMPPGPARRVALREAGRLRVVAEINRWLATQ
jgi:hypothetical protein